MPLLEPQEAADLLRVPKSWIMAEARAQRVPHVRLGRYVRFEQDMLDAWWQKRRHGPWRTSGAAAETARDGAGPASEGLAA